MSEATRTGTKMTFRQFAKSKTLMGGFAALILAGVAVAALFLTGGSKSPEDNLVVDPMPVRIALAREVDTVEYQRIFVGEINAKRTSDLAFERSAKIKEMLVDDGTIVIQGQKLARLDIEDLEISLRIAKAALKNAKAVQAELNQGPRAEVKAAALADVNALTAEKDLAKVIKNKRDELYNTNSISDEEYQQADLRYQAAVQRLEAAKKKYEELNKGTRQEKKDAQDALVEQLQAQVDEIDLNIRKSTLVAPFDGTISIRYLDEGAIVAPGSPVLRITENEKLEAVIGLPPNTVRQIKVGDTLTCQTPLQKSSTEKSSTKNPTLKSLPEKNPAQKNLWQRLLESFRKPINGHA